jgi:predicted alpha/beta hydrolase family esterase
VQIQTLELPVAAERPPTREEAVEPTVLLLPGVDNSGPGHWQTHWELLSNFSRVELGNWSRPKLHQWVPTLDRSISESPRPVILAAHSLGCMAVAWWAALQCTPALADKIAGALLVAPPDVDRVDAPESIRNFRPMPRVRLPFRAIVVASQDDPYASFERSSEMAAAWGCELADAGPIGHINAASRIGGWADGLRLLSEFTGRTPNRLIAELGLRSALS